MTHFDPASEWVRALRQVRRACEGADWSEAERLLAAMQAVDPGHALACLARARYAQARRQPEQACAELERAISRAPDLFDAWLSLGQLRAQLRQYSEALGALQKALQLRPLHLEALELLIALLQLTGDVPAVNACLHLLLDPALPQQPAYRHLPSADQQALLQRLPAWESLAIVNALAWNTLPATDLPARLARWRQRHVAGLQPLTAYGHVSKAPDRPLRVGYVSNEWSNPTLRHVFFGAFQQADLTAFEQIAYADDGSALPAELQSCFKCSRPTAGLDELAFFAQVQADQIDILVDLSGFFNARRLLSLARKPAPVQINAGFNPPFRLGLDCFDAVFSDQGLLPPDPRLEGAESVYYLDSFFCWQPPEALEEAETAQPPSLTGPPRLGAAASLNKLSDLSLRLWAQVLAALPTASLTLKNQVFRDQGVCQRLASRFARLGGDSSRLNFEDNRQRQDLISFFRECDLILETFPYGGALSVCDACWAGVPMPGLAGGFNLAESVRHSLASPDLLADSPAAYVELVVSLCRQPERLQALRQDLPRRLLASPVCRPGDQMRRMEAVYRELWERWRA